MDREVSVKGFCFTIETKRHQAEHIQLDSTILKVMYKGKYHDATTQSEKQKYALKNYLYERLGKSPYICNFIWFRSINYEAINNLVEGDHSRHNYLPNTFNLSYLIKLACTQCFPIVYNNLDYSYFSCVKNLRDIFSEITDVVGLFEKNVQVMGDLTRDKLETITKKLLNKQAYAKAIGEKLVIISGRAGTGKTIKLLRIASDLAINNEDRCLILTYNRALVSDIRRLLALGRFSYRFVNIQTIQSFIRKLILGLQIEYESKLKQDYLDNYDKYLENIYNYIEQEVINDSDIQDLMKKYHETIAWDYVLIDESQDWNLKEKQILYKIFGYNKIIIADGVDQLVRSQIRCEWAKDLKTEDIAKTHEKKCLRQKSNLVSFVNAYANKFGIEWDLEFGEGIIGGKVIIINGEYDFKIHKKEFERCIENGNSAYEMLFLVPPQLVNKEEVYDNRYQKNKIQSKFLQTDKFEKNGVKIWDGTSKNLRTEYPVEVDQHRLLQYDSCRGLEGWTVVCLELDEFIKYKNETYEDDVAEDNTVETEDEKRNKFTRRWSLMPLTRAIDTLIITIKNPQSDLAKDLYEIYTKNDDYIEWIDSSNI